MLSSRLTSKAKINDALIERVAQFVGYLLIGYFTSGVWDALSQTYTYDPGRSEGSALPHQRSALPSISGSWKCSSE